MTLLVGIRCSDGVVLASDSAAAYAQGAAPTIGQQDITKVYQLGDGMIYAASGAVGMQQILRPVLTALWTSGVLSRPEITGSAEAMAIIAGAIANQIRNFVLSATALVPLIGQNDAGATVLTQSLVAVAVKNQASIFTFDYSGAPEELTKELPFVALGSGQRIADPFLAFLKRILWADHEPTLPEGRLVAAWTIRHVAQTNFGGVGGAVQMASLSIKNGTPSIEFADAAEHTANIEAVEAQLRQFVMTQGEPLADAGEAPAPPKPPVN